MATDNRVHNLAATKRLLDLEPPSVPKTVADVTIPEADFTGAAEEQQLTPLSEETQGTLAYRLEQLELVLNRVSELERSQHHPALWEEDEKQHLGGSPRSSNASVSDVEDESHESTPLSLPEATAGTAAASAASAETSAAAVATSAIPLHQLSVPELQQRFEATFGAPSGVSDNAWLLRRLEDVERNHMLQQQQQKRRRKVAAPASGTAIGSKSRKPARRSVASTSAAVAKKELPLPPSSSRTLPKKMTSGGDASRASSLNATPGYAIPATPVKKAAAAAVSAPPPPQLPDGGMTTPPRQPHRVSGKSSKAPPASEDQPAASTPSRRADGKRRSRPNVRYSNGKAALPPPTSPVSGIPAAPPAATAATSHVAPPRASRKRAVPDSSGDDDVGADSARRRKHHNPWTLEEAEALIEGVATCGGGKWADIKKLGHEAIAMRSAVDLKDKWRNLLRIARLPAGESLPGDRTRRELPVHTLERVRELAKLNETKEDGFEDAPATTITTRSPPASKRAATATKTARKSTRSSGRSSSARPSRVAASRR